jgi:hypothetical protein
MLWAVAVVLTVVWVIAILASYTFGGLIHVLLLFAALAVVTHVLRRRRRVA